MKTRKIIKEVIRKDARKEARKILKLSSKKDVKKFKKEYKKGNNENILCLMLDDMKTYLVVCGEMKLKKNDAFGMPVEWMWKNSAII